MSATTGLGLVLHERLRQVRDEGRTVEADRRAGPEDLLKAARAYVNGTPGSWPWPSTTYKPKGHLRNLVRAGALALASLEAATDVVAMTQAADTLERIVRDLDGLLADVRALP